MGYYVIAVGGTGNKILESVVYGACADVFYTQNERGKHKPLPLIHALSVDVDAACGNTTRAKRAAEHYEEIRQAFAAAPSHHRCFHTALQLSRWSMGLDKRAASVDGMVQNHLSDQVLSRTLFSKTESSLEYSEGFRGHPDLGVLFFAELLNALGEPQIRPQPDELLDFIDDMQADLHKEETVKVILCGSIFGGTGASGIPALSQYLRKRFADDNEHFEMASMLMLPYYEVPKATQNEEQEIMVSSAAFIDKARTALQYYGMSGLMRDGANDASGVFDALYLLGLPPESFVTTRNYATGSQSQENDAHLLEWLATRCLSKFFRTGFRGQDARNIDCYYYQWHSPTLSWQSFDLESDLYRVQYGALLKAAAVFFAECYPTLRLRVSAARSHSKRVNYCAPYFHLVGRYPASERARLEKHLHSLYQFFAFYCNWLIQIIRTLPPTLCEDESAAISAPTDLPKNSLLCAELLGELSRLLHEYGTNAALRDNALFDSACLALQKGLQRLIVNRVPDRRNLAHVIAALGGGICDGKNADTALCGFLSTLLQAVAEEEVP
ncbi:MAG: tubulin-like doman-containing protein [Clostridia bacterium]